MAKRSAVSPDGFFPNAEACPESSGDFGIHGLTGSEAISYQRSGKTTGFNTKGRRHEDDDGG